MVLSPACPARPRYNTQTRPDVCRPCCVRIGGLASAQCNLPVAYQSRGLQANRLLGYQPDCNVGAGHARSTFAAGPVGVVRSSRRTRGRRSAYAPAACTPASVSCAGGQNAYRTLFELLCLPPYARRAWYLKPQGCQRHRLRLGKSMSRYHCVVTSALQGRFNCSTSGLPQHATWSWSPLCVVS